MYYYWETKEGFVVLYACCAVLVYTCQFNSHMICMHFDLCVFTGKFCLSLCALIEIIIKIYLEIIHIEASSL